MTQQTEISIIRNFGDRQLLALEMKISSIKPGQYYIVYNPEKDDHLYSDIFALQLDEIFFMKPQEYTLGNW